MDQTPPAESNPLSANPFLDPWNGPFGIPPFERLRPESFRPAFDAGLAEQKAEIESIAGNSEKPTFENTIDALERSGQMLDRVSSTFFNLAGADTNDDLEAIERDITPLLSRHNSEIYLNEALFWRVADLHERREELGLTAERKRVLERYHTIFLRAGAALPAEVRMSPSSTNNTAGSSNTCGNSDLNRSACRQCVVAGRPSSSPASARMKLATISEE